MTLQPISLREARAFVNEYHRHNVAPQGGKFAIGLGDDGEVVGVAIVGRPIARHNDDGWTAEVTRLCVMGNNPNACSMLYSACWRACRAMGYQRLITYTLKTEPGTSLRAAGWKIIGETAGAKNGWNCKSRARTMPARYPTEEKFVWEIAEVSE